MPIGVHLRYVPTVTLLKHHLVMLPNPVLLVSVRSSVRLLMTGL